MNRRKRKGKEKWYGIWIRIRNQIEPSLTFWRASLSGFWFFFLRYLPRKWRRRSKASEMATMTVQTAATTHVGVNSSVVPSPPPPISAPCSSLISLQTARRIIKVKEKGENVSEFLFSLRAMCSLHSFFLILIYRTFYIILKSPAGFSLQFFLNNLQIILIFHVVCRFI